MGIFEIVSKAVTAGPVPALPCGQIASCAFPPGNGAVKLVGALANARRMRRCCAAPLGAERPLLAPSWLIAEPRMTASTGWPSRCASDNRANTSIPTPSAQLVPSASAEKDLHRPSGASPRCRENSTNMPGVPITAAPPASASEQSPARSAWQAQCSATSEDEHAVSTVAAGPSRPRRYAIRPDATLTLLPVSRYPPTPPESCRRGP